MTGGLAFFFTRRMGLRRWHNYGMFEREVALYRRLREHLDDVLFVTDDDLRDLRFANHPHLKGIEVACNAFRLPWPVADRMLMLGHGGTLARAGVFKSNQVPGADRGLALARRYGKPFIARCGYLHAQFVRFDKGPDAPETRAAEAMERHVFLGADRVVVTTGAMREEIMRDYGLEAARIRVIPNYVDTDVFRPLLPADERVARDVLFVGRLNRQKNLPVLLRAVAGTDLRLHLVGQGEERDALEGLARELNVEAVFHGVCQHRELAEKMSRCGAFVLPSLYEGHPKALIEAMACGAPVVAASVPGVAEVVDHGETGWLAPEPTAEALRKGLLAVAGDADLRRRLGEGARRVAVTRYSLDSVVGMELDLYRELA